MTAIADAFRIISVGGINVRAEQVGDTLTIIAGNNIEITPNVDNDSIEISASGTLAADLPITQDNNGNITNYIVFSGSTTGNLSPRIDTGLYYNPFTNTLTAGVFNGPSSSWSTARTVSFSGGDVTGSFSIDGTANVSNVALTIGANSVALGTDTTGNYVAIGATSGNGISGSTSTESATFTVSSNATALNTAETIVYRDTSGNFSAGTISATFSGNLTGDVTGNVSGSSGSTTGNAATVTNGVYTTGSYSDPSWLTISASKVGLGNVTNESKATMFTNPTFTGTVSGVTATHVGLGNVTNESKATMFTSPTFTGTVQASTLTLSNPLDIAYGGTGSTGSTGALTNLVPTGEVSGYVLKTSGRGSYYWSAETGASTVVGTRIDTSRVEFTATENQTVFTGVGTYTAGTGQLRVYIDGVRQFPAAYSETSTTSFTLSSGVPGGTKVLAEVDGYIDLAVVASAVTFSPVGSIAATDVQAAIAELDTEKASVANPTFTGTVTLQQTVEVIDTKTSATGTVVHDFSTGAIWYHSSISSDFTANFTNVPTTNNRSITVALILDQGATAYIPTAVQIDGVAQTIKWGGGSVPSGTNNYTDIVNFTLIRSASAWTVLGSVSTYN